MMDAVKKVVIVLIGAVALPGIFACGLSQPDDTSTRQDYGISGPTSVAVGNSYGYAVSGPPNSQVYVRWYKEGSGIGGGNVSLDAKGRGVANWTFTEPGQYTVNVYRDGTQGDITKASLPNIVSTTTSSVATSVPAFASTVVPLVSSFDSISSGNLHTCGVTTNGSIVCWGDNEYGQASPPDGQFRAVSAGSGHTCGVKTDGFVECWGSDEYGQATPPPDNFSSVSVGVGYTCGVKADSEMLCWGRNDYGEASPPAGAFSSVSSGFFHTCGIKTDGKIDCWGDSTRSEHPDDIFYSVSVSSDHTCGVKKGWSVICWGNDQFGVTTPTSEPFSSVDTGGLHTCGRRSDGLVVCWGHDGDGQSTPPPGVFDSVSAGNRHTCGVKPDGSVVCWGSNDFGQADPTSSARSESYSSDSFTKPPNPTATPRPTARPPLPRTSSLTDRDALIALHSATGSEFWEAKENWDSVRPLGEWEGVTTDVDGRVVELDLRPKYTNQPKLSGGAP